jgi:DNA polymerase II small subunit/DNA polymerase delta subunit B
MQECMGEVTDKLISKKFDELRLYAQIKNQEQKITIKVISMSKNGMRVFNLTEILKEMSSSVNANFSFTKMIKNKFLRLYKFLKSDENFPDVKLIDSEENIGGNIIVILKN